MQTKLLGLVWVLISVLMVHAGNAQTTNISAKLHFEGDGACDLWDVSGHYSQSLDGASMDFTLNMDSQGKITGTGTAFDSGLGMDFTYTGAVSKSGNITRVTLNFKAKGSILFDGKTYRYTATAKANFVIDPAAQAMTGTTKITVSAGGHSASDQVSETWDLPAGMDGGWDLEVAAQEKGKTLLGNAKVTLSTGKQYNLGVKGTLSSKTGLYSASLTGKTGAKGVSMKVTVDPSFALRKLTGKVCGQAIKVSSGT